MPTIMITEARKDIYNVAKEVCDNAEPTLIVNSRGNNVVMMSEDEYEDIKETLFFLENPVMMKKITEALNTPREDYVKFDDWRK